MCQQFKWVLINHFSLDTFIADVSGLVGAATASVTETPDCNLLKASGVIFHREGSVRFTHDLVHQDAYSLFRSHVHREKTHFAIGQSLLQSLTVDGLL